MSCQNLLLVYSFACTECSLLDVLLVGLSRILFVLGILPADLGESLRFRISLVLKADRELLKVLFYAYYFSRQSVALLMLDVTCLVYFQLV